MNKYRIEKDRVYCQCSNEDIEFIIDKEDYNKIKPYTWRSHRQHIETSILINGKYKNVSLSKFLLNKLDNNEDKKIMHKNKNSLDYRKLNLFSQNNFIDKGYYFEVECFDGQTFLINKDDYDLVSKYKWHINFDKRNGYKTVVAKVDNKMIKLHRLLLDCVNIKCEIDHINRNTLDNRRINLRISNRSENCFNRGISDKNSSGVIGVYKPKQYNKWCVKINKNGISHYLGSYDSLSEATTVRKQAELKYFSEYTTI